jgi:hypothetical protein
MSIRSKLSTAWSLLHARMAGWLYVSLALALAILLLAPYQLPVTLYKLSLITSGAWLGYWLDRALFPYARPGCFIQWGASPGGPGVVLSMTDVQVKAFAAAMLRRALIIAAVVVAVALGA